MAGNPYSVDPQTEGLGPPNMAAQLFGMISSLPDAYQQGVEQKFKRGQMGRIQELQKPILGPDGKPTQDVGLISQELLKRGGGEYAKDLLPFIWKQQFLNEDQGAGGGQSPYGGPPQIGRGYHGQTNMDPNILHAQAGEPPRLGSEPQGDTVNPRRIGDQAQNLTGPTIQPRRRQDDVGSTSTDFQQPGSPEPTQAGTGAPQQAPSGASGMVPPGADPRAYAQALKQAAEGERTRARREAIAGIPSKAREDKAAAYDKTADDILKEIGEAGRPTGPQKEFRDPIVQAGKASTKLSEDVAAAKGKRIGEVIEAGGLPGRQMLNTLNVMEDAFKQGGANISTGPGAEAWLKVKQAANNLFPGIFNGVPESEAVQKLNAQLAAAAAKAMTARPSQLEFRAFMANNPGLLTSKEGSFALINVLRQAKEQDIALSRLAMNNRNHDNWTEIEDKFYKEHPIKSPFTGKALTGQEKPAAAGLPPPQIGEIHNGHRYLGGNPKDSKSWAPVIPAERT